MLKIIFDVVLSLFAVIGLLLLICEVEKLFFRNRKSRSLYISVLPDGCESLDILNEVKSVYAQSYIFVCEKPIGEFDSNITFISDVSLLSAEISAVLKLGS